MADLGQLVKLPAVNYGQLLNNLGLFATIVTIGAVFIGIMLVIRYIRGYSKKTWLLVKANEGLVLVRDKGKPDFKTRDFTLLKRKEIICPFPESRHYVPEGKTDNLFGFVENNTCTWLTVSKNPHFVPSDINMMNFTVDMYARIDEATKLKVGFWDKYGHQILWAATIAIFMISLIFILKSVDKAIAMGTSVAAERAKATTQQLVALYFLARVRK